MKYGAILAPLLIMFLFAGKGYSQAVDCSKASTQTEINICAQKEYAATDKELNILYKKVSAKLTPAQKTSLILSQRKWISFRDEYSKIYALIYEGGSIASSAISNCKTETTRARITELKRLYEQISL